MLCVISGFRREADEIYALLRYYAAYVDNTLPTFRDNLSVPIYKGQEIQILDFWALISIDSFLVPWWSALDPLSTGCTRFEVSTFNGKTSTFDITDINIFFVHSKYWKMIRSLSFDWLCAIISLSICPIRKQTPSEISSTFCHHLRTTKKSKPITKNFSLDRSSSHRAWNITFIAVVIGSFSDTSIRRVVEGLKSSGLSAYVVRYILSVISRPLVTLLSGQVVKEEYKRL